MLLNWKRLLLHILAIRRRRAFIYRHFNQNPTYFDHFPFKHLDNKGSYVANGVGGQRDEIFNMSGKMEENHFNDK